MSAVVDFRQRVQGSVQKAQQYAEPLNAEWQEARNFDFLAAGKLQVKTLKDRVQMLQTTKKNLVATLSEAEREYANSSAHKAELSLELQFLKKLLKAAPPIVPFEGILLEGGQRLSSRVRVLPK